MFSDLILACAEFDAEAAEDFARRTAPIKSEPVDADSLENLPTPSISAIKRKEERQGDFFGSPYAKTAMRLG